MRCLLPAIHYLEELLPNTMCLSASDSQVNHHIYLSSGLST